jgi:hypothetical protein
MKSIAQIYGAVRLILVLIVVVYMYQLLAMTESDITDRTYDQFPQAFNLE